MQQSDKATSHLGKGTGLGLSQVHGFVHQADGTVKVESKLNEGTTITMYFPRAEIAEVEADPGIKVAKAGGGTVLLVEDNPDVAIAGKMLLEQLGYTVRWARDAEAALLEIESDGIDLVFSDIVMPGRMDGIGLAAFIKEKHPGLPVLLATGYSEELYKLRSDVPVLRKPYQIHELSHALGALR